MQHTKKIHEFIDCFFTIYKILLESESEKVKEKDKSKEEIKISTLGDLNKNIEEQEKKEGKLKKIKFDSGNINLEYLWEKKMCTSQGKTFVNANIRNKLQNQLKGNERYI